MPNLTIARRRLAASGLDMQRFASPEALVSAFGAVQGQDYGPASWGIGQRLGPHATVSDIDAGFDAGRFLRTHAMRPTWHFLPPPDIRWILALTSHRVHRLNALYYRRLELDGPTLARGTDTLVRALEGGRHLTRSELAVALAGSGIEAAGQRLAYLVMHAELDAIVVSGPRRGRQFTYALFDERVPASDQLGRSAALAELTRRYFTTHGPAQPRDFAWWSGLRIADAKEGLSLAGDTLARERIDDADWWWNPAIADAPGPAGRTEESPAAIDEAPEPLIHLLPALDEYTVSYRDHSPVFDRSLLGARSVDDVFFFHVIVRDGLLIGGWRREVNGRTVIVRADPLVELAAASRAALERAAAAYGRFLGADVRIEPRLR